MGLRAGENVGIGKETGHFSDKSEGSSEIF